VVTSPGGSNSAGCHCFENACCACSDTAVAMALNVAAATKSEVTPLRESANSLSSLATCAPPVIVHEKCQSCTGRRMDKQSPAER
jgi:hypothetical protein